MNQKIIENEFTKLWIEDGIMYGEYKEDIIIDVEAAKKIAADRIALCNNKSYPFLGTAGSIKNLTKEARDYFSKGDGIKYMKKLAIFTTSPISRMVGNFFLAISKPTVPTRVFTVKDEAIRWLKED
jgi:hypothetical protein